jgi:hypothetical protein
MTRYGAVKRNPQLNNQEKGLWFVYGFGTMGVLFSLILYFATLGDKIRVGDIVSNEDKCGVVVSVGDNYINVYEVDVKHWTLDPPEERIKKIHYE